ncbi:MAG TPA: hypothetical protein VF812_04820 [Ktedonobacterales bacterium]
MSLDTVILIIAAVISLPGGLFVAFLVSQPRTRWLGLVGGVLGAAITAVALEYFVHAASVAIDAVSWFFGAFLACSMGVATGALLVGFFAGSGRSDTNSAEV